MGQCVPDVYVEERRRHSGKFLFKHLYHLIELMEVCCHHRTKRLKREFIKSLFVLFVRGTTTKSQWAVEIHPKKYLNHGELHQD